MSAYSTLTITRETAINKILAFVLQAENKELERLLDAVLEDRLYNCRIVPNDCEENDDAAI